jgi:hypothetical protein
MRLRGVADCSRRPRIRHGHDDVSFRRMLNGEPLAHLVTRFVDGLTVDQGIGSREIDVLEDAHRMRAFGERVRCVQTFAIDNDHLARLNVAHIARFDEIEGARLRSHDPRRAEFSQGERAKAARVAYRDQGVRRQKQH